MEFGKLASIAGVNWALPLEDDSNANRIIPGNGSLQILLGSPSWGQRSWIGEIYPPGTKPEDFLYYYARHFDAIELNTSHYRIPTSENVKQWRSRTPEHFEFCPKVFKEISHTAFGLVDQHLLKQWYLSLELFSNQLGPCFIQFHENFSYQNKALLFRFLENWPTIFPLSIELRHSSWYQNNRVLPALSDYLYQRKIGLVITDVAGRRDILHSSISSNWSMIRLIGNDLDPSDNDRVQAWINRFIQWKKAGLSKIYLFLHQPEDIHTIEFAKEVSENLKQRGLIDRDKFSLAPQSNGIEPNQLEMFS